MYRDFRQKQAALEAKVLAGETPSDEEVQALQQAMQIVALNPYVRKLLEAEAAFAVTFAEVQRILAGAVGIELPQAPAPGPAAGSAGAGASGAAGAAAEGSRCSGGRDDEGGAARSRLWVPGREGALRRRWSLSCCVEDQHHPGGHQGQSVERDAAGKAHQAQHADDHHDRWAEKTQGGVDLKRRLHPLEAEHQQGGGKLHRGGENPKQRHAPDDARLVAYHAFTRPRTGAVKHGIATRSPFLLVLPNGTPGAGALCRREPPGAGRGALERALPKAGGGGIPLPK